MVIMKSKKISLDFSDIPELIDQLRLVAAREGTSQKAGVVKALEAFFADKFESDILLRAANQTFAEWDNKEDSVYDTL